MNPRAFTIRRAEDASGSRQRDRLFRDRSSGDSHPLSLRQKISSRKFASERRGREVKGRSEMRRLLPAHLDRVTRLGDSRRAVVWHERHHTLRGSVRRQAVE